MKEKSMTKYFDSFLTLDFRHWIFDIGWSSVFFIPVITFSVIGLLSIKVGDKLLIWNKDKSFLRQKENKHKSNWGGRKFYKIIYLLSWKGKNKLENFNRLFETEYESQRKKDFYSKESVHYYSTIKAPDCWMELLIRSKLGQRLISWIAFFSLNWPSLYIPPLLLP